LKTHKNVHKVKVRTKCGQRGEEFESARACAAHTGRHTVQIYPPPFAQELQVQPRNVQCPNCGMIIPFANYANHTNECGSHSRSYGL
jgi:ribosomal protein S27AE